MPTVIISPNMLLPVPITGSTPGPEWANDINNCLSLVDSHNHTPGYGVQVPSDGLNINADLSFQDNNLTNARSIRFFVQPSPLALPSDLACVYVSGVDLYYNDASGNQIRLTESGAPAGTPGSITNLIPPAAVTYVPPSQLFVFTSAPNTPANLDAGYINLRNFVLNSKALTLQPPAAMAADYTITLPSLPVSKKMLTMTSSGVMAADYDVDNVSIAVASNLLTVQAAGIINGPGLSAVGNKIELSGGVYNSRQFLANGPYSGTAFPQTQIDGYFFFPFNATITSIWIFNLTAGASGTTEFDLKLASSPGGSFASILSTTGKIDSSAIANVWTDSGSIVAPLTGVTKPVLSSASVNAGDCIRFDLIQGMASPASDCGLIVNFIPR